MATRFKKFMSATLAVAIMIVTFLSSPIVEKLSAEATDAFFSLSLNTTTPSITTGEQARMTLSYGFSNLTSHYEKIKLEFTIPNELVNASLTASNMPVVYSSGESASISPVISGNVITYTTPAGKFVEPGYAGGIELIKVQTASFYTLPGNVNIAATISATVDGKVQSLTDKLPIEVKVNPNWNIVKTAQFPTYNESTYARFRMFIQAPNQNGNLAAKSFVVTDALPYGVDFVAFDDPNDANITKILPGLDVGNNSTWGSAKPQPHTSNATKYPAGTVTQKDNVITWNVPNTAATYDNASYLELTFWVKIRDDVLTPDTGNVQTITNTGDLTAELINGKSYKKTATGSLIVIDSVGDTQNQPEKAIYFKNAGYGLDTNSVYFAIKASSFFNKSSTINIENFVLEDTSLNWSEALKLKDVRIPAMNTGNDAQPYLSYTVEFLSGTNVIKTHIGTTASTKTYTAPVGSDGYRIKIALLPRGTGGTGSSMQDVVVGFNLDASKVTSDRCVYNRATFRYLFAGQENTVIKTSGCEPLATTGATRVGLSKQIDNKKGIYQYNDIVNYSISYNNSLFSGKSAQNVMFYDLLPKNIKFIPNTVTGNVDVLSVTDNYKGTGQQMIAFKLRTALEANSSGVFKFNAYVTEDVKTQAYINEIYMLSDTRLDVDFDNGSYSQDVSDIDMDGDITESIVKATASFDAAAYTSILIVKEVKGDLDTEWSKYPAIATVSSGGQLQYRMTIKNLSPKAMNNINVVDILPYVGDTGVLVSTPRQSKWTPYLKAAITAPENVAITYSTSSNPNRGVIGRPLIGESNTVWSTTPPADITTVRSIKLNYTKTLDPGGTFVFTYDMVTPIGVPQNGETAWNSFGMQARDAVTGSMTIPVEPKEVGVKTAPPSYASLTGKAWLDGNKDGKMDSAESGLNGILVYLLDKNGMPVLDKDGNKIYTITANNIDGQPGYYGFSNVVNGDYIVEFKPIAGYGKSLVTGYDNPLDQNLNDYNALDFKTAVISLKDKNVDHIDAGFTLGKIGDFVFEDNNLDGIQDLGENGISGMKVNLLKDGAIITSTITDSNGYYQFDRLPQGNYTLSLQKPILYNFSPSHVGSDPKVDSDFVPMNLQNAQTNTVTLSSDEHGVIQDNLTIDAGLFKGRSIIIGTVWDDLNRDDVYGLKPAEMVNEDGISGVKLFLYNSEGVLIATTTTDIDGNYIFTGLPADNYIISLDAPKGYQLVKANVGMNRGNDSDFDPITKKTAIIYLGVNEKVVDIDAGLYTAPKGQITGKAFTDDNYNCLQGSDEGNYEGLIVNLLDFTTSDLIQQTTTNNQGIYTFLNVASGIYKIEVVNNSTNFLIGNASTVFDQQIVLLTNDTVITNIPENGICMQYKKSGLGDYVWLDINRNGLQDSDEKGLEGVTLILYDTDDNVIATTTSDAHGYYHFDQIVPNKAYRIEVTLPSDQAYQFTIYNATPLVDNSLAKERSLGGQIADIAVASLPPNTSNTTYDVGVVYAPASIGDYLFLDTNSNGTQDVDDLPLRNVVVELYEKQAEDLVFVKSVTTNEEGKYLFSQLNPANYVVKIKRDTVPEFLTPIFKNYFLSSTENDSDIDRITYQTDVIALQSGQKKNDIDAGFMYLMTEIGDYVWLDLDRNGIQDTTDQPLKDILISLYKMNSEGEKILVRQTTTDEHGNYFFNIVQPLLYKDGVFEPQTYFLGITVPDLYDISPNLAVGSDATVDNNFSVMGDQVLSQPIIMTESNIGKHDYSIDAALVYEYSSIGDYVWLDINRNGQQDAEDYPKSGVLINLSKKNNQLWEYIGQKQTDSQGKYLFDNLEPGIYQLEIVPPENHQLVSYRIGSDNDDNDFCPVASSEREYFGIVSTNCQMVAPNMTREIVLGPKENITNIDAGLQQKYAEIGDRIWLDKNRNNQQDLGEVGIANVGVYLLNEKNIVVDSKITDLQGNYLFTNVEAGQYRIEVHVPTDYVVATQYIGADLTDSNINSSTNQSDMFTLKPGEVNTTIDAGLQYKLASIGDYVWFDANEDGIQDISEHGISGIALTLLDEDGNIAKDGYDQPIDMVITDAAGAYVFPNLNPGKYSIRMELTTAQQNYYQATSVSAGTDITLDSNIKTDFTTNQFTLAPNQREDTIDVGLVNKKASLSGYTWVDSNQNGVQDLGEPALSKVPVTLYDVTSGTSVEVATLFTDASGKYIFSELDPTKTYQVLFGEMKDYDETVQYNGDSDFDSDMNQETRWTKTIKLENGQYLQHIDGGYVYPFSKLGNYVWMDTNQNGVQDSNEIGIAGVKVELLDEHNNAVADGSGNYYQITDASGYYYFDKLHGNQKYKIKVNLPIDYIGFTLRGTDSKNDQDSNVDANGFSDVFELDILEHNMTIDAGLIPKKGSLGNYVWLDKNKDGVQDTNERGIENITIILTDENGMQTITTTDAYGKYNFAELTVGKYCIKPLISDAYLWTIQYNGAENQDSNFSNTQQEICINLKPNEQNDTIDAGFIYKEATIGDYIWFDTNENGVQEIGENGIAGIEVAITNEDGTPVYDVNGQLVNKQLTTSNGKYKFEKLSAGTYKVSLLLKEEQKVYYQETLSLQGVDNATDSDFDADYTSFPITIQYGENNQNFDFGLINHKASIGGYTWIDSNTNGLQDSIETPLGNVLVELYVLEGSETYFVNQMITSADGHYLFENVTPNKTYRIKMTPPVDYDTTSKLAGPQNEDSDIDQLTGWTDNIVVKNGDNIRYIDGGYVYPYSIIGNYVFMDINADGFQDANELGIKDVKIELLDENDILIADGLGRTTVLSDSSGYYRFEKLHGDKIYKIRATLPAKYERFSPKGSDLLSNTDSNVSDSGLSDAIYLSDGEHNLTIDVGLIPEKGSIGNYIWLDINKDGIQDTNEVGVQGVTVNLFDDKNVLIATQITDAHGHYLFENLLVGSYIVKVEVPQQYKWTEKQATTDDFDSDFDSVTNSKVVIVNPGDDILTIDGGFVYRESTLGNYIWFDANENGIQDVEELGIANIRVKLVKSDGTPAQFVDGVEVETTTTDSLGYYQFNRLPAGKYKIILELDAVQQQYYQVTLATKGADTSLDSNILYNFETNPIELAYDEHNLSIDGGLINKRASIGDYTWIDRNRNGVQDENGGALSGVKVSLFSSKDGVEQYIATQTTDDNGYYLFDNLNPLFMYRLYFETPNNYAITTKNSGDAHSDSNIDKTTGWTDSVSVQNGENNMTIDAGFIPLTDVAAVVTTVCKIDNQENRKPAANVKVKLTSLDDDNKSEYEAISDATGRLNLGILPIGKYLLTILEYPDKYFDELGEVVQPQEIVITEQTAYGFVLPELVLNVMRCFEFGNKVFIDENKNGVQDSDEKGLNGVKVLLFDEQGNPVMLDDATQKQDVTETKENFQIKSEQGFVSEDGIYRMKILHPGKYQAQFILPEGYAFTNKNIGNNDELDSDVNTQSGLSDIVEITTDKPWNYNVDAGVYKVDATELPITGTEDNNIYTIIIFILSMLILIYRVKKHRMLKTP